MKSCRKLSLLDVVCEKKLLLQDYSVGWRSYIVMGLRLKGVRTGQVRAYRGPRRDETYKFGITTGVFRLFFPRTRWWCSAPLALGKSDRHLCEKWKTRAWKRRSNAAHLLTSAHLEIRCATWVCFLGIRKVTETAGCSLPINFWCLNGVGGRGRGTSAKAYLHLYESDVHLWHLIISQVLVYWI